MCFRADDPGTFHSMYNLAETYRYLDDLEKATDLNKEALEGQKRVLGAEHPDTLKSLYQLAKLRRTTGNMEDAVELHRSVLDVRLRTLGPEHPDTIASLKASEEITEVNRRESRDEETMGEELNNCIGGEHGINTWSVVTTLWTLLAILAAVVGVVIGMSYAEKSLSFR